MKNKIVLFAPSPEKNHYWSRVPISILAVSGLLEKNGYIVKILTSNDPYWKQLISYETKDAILFGVTAMTGYQITEGLIAAKLCRNANSNIPIVFGGWHPTILPIQTCEHPLVDIVVKGQGERTLLNLANCLASQGNISTIDGIVYKSNDKIIENKDTIPEDINNFPMYSYHLIDCEQYIHQSDLGKRTLNYISARGCPHRCKFCAEMMMNKRHWFALSSERVVDELAFLTHKYNLDSFNIDDTNFFMNKKRTIEICEGILKKNLKIRLGSLSAHARDMLKYEEDTFQLMKKSGIYGIYIGAEGGNNETLEFVNKDTTIDEILMLVEKCGRYKFKVNLSFIVGFPKTISLSIEKQITDILLFLDKCFKYNKFISSCIYLYTPYPGSPMYEDALKDGLNVPKSLEEWGCFIYCYSHLPHAKNKYVRIINTINFTLFYLYAKYTKDKDFAGHTYLWGRNWFRRYIYKLVEIFMLKLENLRWKHKFFVFPIEIYIFNFIMKLGKKIQRII